MVDDHLLLKECTHVTTRWIHELYYPLYKLYCCSLYSAERLRSREYLSITITLPPSLYFTSSIQLFYNIWLLVWFFVWQPTLSGNPLVWGGGVLPLLLGDGLTVQREREKSLQEDCAEMVDV